MAKRFHEEAFDEATLNKLAIYRDYLTRWLPVFIQTGRPGDSIRIFDFFAGPGADANNNSGSPLIAIEAVDQYRDSIQERNLTVELHFSDAKVQNIQLLKNRIAEWGVLDPVTIPPPKTGDFSNLFKDALPAMQNSCNLIFADQFGVKHVTEEVLLAIADLQRTDFLFFVSSSYLGRFAERPEFQAYFQKIDPEALKAGEAHHVHRQVVDYYRSLIPSSKSYFLAPFSLKKGSNYYGLIFGSGHPLGLEKFLECCWAIDPQRGEADYDIDQDNIDQAAPHLFADFDVPKKTTVFREKLIEAISKKAFQTDADIRRFMLQEGFLNRHTRPILDECVKKGLLCKKSKPRLSKSADKEPRELHYS